MSNVKNKIESFFHCKGCLEKSGDDPYIQYMECGWTKKGIQVWCKTCEKNMIDIDFCGQKVKAK